jgi:two-component system, OmpR family, response regulator
MFLTARDATEDKIAGFTAGGDDYLTKPFSLDELIARVRAMVRRNNLAPR